MNQRESSSSERRSRHYSKPPKKTSPMKKFLWIFVILSFIIIAGAGCGFISATMQNLPDVGTVKPAASSQIYDVNGELIQTMHAEENRLPVKLNQVPKSLQNAFVATEDARFYSHHGVDPVGILRAIWVNIVRDGVSEGGSTITQQLARNAFLTQDRTIKRKVMEALLALKIEQRYTKQEILEMYMNQIYFGQGAYGVQSASKIYFGKDVKDLTLAQATILAGLPQSPNYYSPFNNLEAAKKRQAIVLGQMVKYGYLDQASADEAKNADLALRDKAEVSHSNNSASYFIDYITQLISEKYGPDAIYKDGLKIYTTLNMKAQAAAVRAMQDLPTFYTDKNGLQQPQGALVAINPHNGHIVAMVGGRGTDSFNRAVLSERQPGSAFKPFVYLAAIQRGQLTPGTIIDDSKVDYNGWSPKNYDNSYSGKITARYALAHSVNIAAVKVADEVGMSRVLDLAKNMGITTLTNGDNNLAAALGGLTNGVSPLEIASAYATFANNGIHVKPVAITKIIDRNGQVIEESSLEENQVVSAKEAAILTSMLRSVITDGTGGNAAIGRPAAGKTGTTDDSKDAWFVGYTPDLATAVWLGDDYGVETLNGTTGGTIPAMIWHDFMASALANTPVSDFDVPADARGAISEGMYIPKPDPPPKKEDKKEDVKNDKDSKDDTVKDDDSKNEKSTKNTKEKKTKKE